ncbi:hypothetical protein SAMN04488511_12823, partial [Pedobacter suwonensis]
MNNLDALVQTLYNIYLVLNKEQLKFTFIDLFGDPETQLTRQQVKDYLNISESTYKRKVKDG